MDSDSLNQLPTPKEQTYFKLHKPKLALVVDNTKQKKSKVISNLPVGAALPTFLTRRATS